MSKQKELDTDLKAIKQIELLTKKLTADDADDNATDPGDNDQSMFVLTILEKNKESRWYKGTHCVSLFIDRNTWVLLERNIFHNKY